MLWPHSSSSLPFNLYTWVGTIVIYTMLISTFFLLSMFVIININLHLYKNISKNNIIKVVMVNRYRLFISLTHSINIPMPYHEDILLTFPIKPHLSTLPYHHPHHSHYASLAAFWPHSQCLPNWTHLNRAHLLPIASARVSCDSKSSAFRV